MGKFSFYAEYEDDYNDPEDAICTGYKVGLPHQCDTWEITNATTKDRAMEELRDFIKEAQLAYEKLASLRDDAIGKKIKEL